jgi:pimeloyl-ACP methyl ester carboxylesterase
MLSTPDVEVHYEVYGSGAPVTLFAHGMGSNIEETRPFASGVSGTRAFVEFRGHGTSGRVDGGYDYDGLAGDLLAVADEVSATRCLGVSMGSATLLRVLTDTPDRFDKCVFALPASIDKPRRLDQSSRLSELGRFVETRDIDGLTDYFSAEMPEVFRGSPQLRDFMRQRAETLLTTDVLEFVRTLPTIFPVTDVEALQKVTVPSLVIGQEGDEVHPASIARELAAALPNAQLHVYDKAWEMWGERGGLRELVTGFLND